MGEIVRYQRRPSSISTAKRQIDNSDLVVAKAFFMTSAAVLLIAVLFAAFPQLASAEHLNLVQSRVACETGKYGPDAFWKTTSVAPFEIPAFPVAAEATKLKTKKIRKDDDAGLQLAFETEFTCAQVVTEDATQCKEKDDQGRSVRSFCQKSCKKARKQAKRKQVDANPTPNFTRDGDYAHYTSSFSQCAAVGSEQDSCASGDSRGEGCACQSSSQCGAIQGANCCYQGFCSYEHLAPLDPCM